MRSVLIPLRGVVTIALTVFTGFAVMVCVYQYGSLPPGPFGHLDGVSFFVPPVAATIVLGLSLDYDVRAAASQPAWDPSLEAGAFVVQEADIHVYIGRGLRDPRSCQAPPGPRGLFCFSHLHIFN